MSFKKDLSLLSSTDPNDFAAATNSDSTEKSQRERGLQHKTGNKKKYSQYAAVRRSRENFRSHSLIVGDIGSGKNLIGDAYLASLLANRKPDDKFVLFDPKGTIQQLLGGLDVPYTLINADDERSAAVDIIKDCTSPTVMLGYAKALFPDKQGGGGDNFWPFLAQSITIGLKNAMVDVGYRAPFLATLIRVLREIGYFGTETSEKDETKTKPIAFYKTVLSHSPLNKTLLEVLDNSENVEAGVFRRNYLINRTSYPGSST